MVGRPSLLEGKGNVMIQSIEPKDCRCSVCLCPRGTRHPNRICRDCERADHPGDRRA